MVLQPGATTIRDQIMDYFVALYSGLKAGQNGFNHTWDTVVRRPLTKEEMRDGKCISLIDVNERKSPEIGTDRALLRVIVEFTLPLSEDETPSKVLNRALGDVIRASGLDIQCGRLSLNVEEEGNELDNAVSNDKVASGVVVLVVTYKHKSNDPTRKN